MLVEAEQLVDGRGRAGESIGRGVKTVSQFGGRMESWVQAVLEEERRD